jgi:hypothetical protein
MVTGAQYSVKFGTNTYVRFSIQSVATVEGGTTRTSSKTDTGNFIQVGFAPLAPTGLTYTDSAVTLTIPADDIGTSTGRMVKLTSTMLDGTVQQLGSWTRNGAAATLTVASSTIVKNAARFTLNATIANTFSATIASRSLVVDLDRNQFLIGSRRHLAYIIESGSTTAKPVSVRVI